MRGWGFRRFYDESMTVEPGAGLENGARGERNVRLLAFVAFVILGLPFALLGVAWPSIQGTFHRALGELGLLVGVYSAGYLVASFTAGGVVRTWGVGGALVYGAAVSATGLVLSASAPVWAIMSVAGFLMGLGNGSIDAAINSLASQRFSPRVLNWLHGCWGVGATIGPAVMTLCLTRGWGWRVGYGWVALVMAGMGLVFLATRRMWATQTKAAQQAERPASFREAIGRLDVWMGVGLFFMYGGVEVGAGNWLFTLLTENRGMALAAAGMVVSCYWGSLTAGRFVFGQISAKTGAEGVIRLGLATGLAGALLLSLGIVLPWTLVRQGGGALGAVLVGFGIAPVFPSMVSLTPRRVGARYASQAVGFQLAGASVGFMILPGVIGAVAKLLSLEVLGVWLFLGSAAMLVFFEIAAKRTSRLASEAAGV